MTQHINSEKYKAKKMHHRWDPKLNMEYFKYLNKGQLWELLGDEETLQRTARNNPKFQELQRQRKLLWSSNYRLAEQNLSYQPYLKYKKLLLAERYQLLGQLISSVRHKQKNLDRLHGQLSLKATQQLLREKLAYLKDESEGLWQKFMEGKMLLVDFMESFQSTQKFYHAYLVQVEKMQDLSVQTHGHPRKKELLANDQMSSNAITMFYSLSPLIMLPNSVLPLMGRSAKTPYLPHLNHYVSADLWMPLIRDNNPGHSQEFKKTWPQTQAHLQHYKKT